MKVDFSDLGRVVAERRIQLGLTQAQLAERCDLSDSYIGCIERANRKISLESLLALSKALHLSPNDLLCGSLQGFVFHDQDALTELLDKPLKLREPDYTLRNTLTNWYFADLPDESRLSDQPVSPEQLSRLQFTLLGDEFPPFCH